MPDPSAIMALATGYWASMVLFTANRLNVFTLLSAGPGSADEVAQECGAHPRPMAMLLNACVAQGLLRREDGRYANAAAAEAFLVQGQPGYLGDALKYSDDLYPVWGRLAETVGSNSLSIPAETILGADPEKTRNFVLGMHNRARGVAACLARSLDLRGRKRLLDVGGGPGTYAILLVSQTPGLSATVLDLPAVVAIGKEIIASSGCGDRIEAVAGDYALTPFPGGYDVVLMSGILHRETPERCRRLLTKAFDALRAGGLAVVSDVFFEDEARDSPPFATLFALNMLLTSEHGSAHAKTEMARWMAEAGFLGVEARPLPPPMPHTLVLGAKP
jgi:predicted O-methyltransferase YrrM